MKAQENLTFQCPCWLWSSVVPLHPLAYWAAQEMPCSVPSSLFCGRTSGPSGLSEPGKEHDKEREETVSSLQYSRHRREDALYPSPSGILLVMGGAGQTQMLRCTSTPMYGVQAVETQVLLQPNPPSLCLETPPDISTDCSVMFSAQCHLLQKSHPTAHLHHSSFSYSAFFSAPITIFINLVAYFLDSTSECELHIGRGFIWVPLYTQCLAHLF